MLYEMILVDAMDMRPLGHCSYLIKLDYCQFSCSVLVYCSLFDPRPCPSGLPLTFELCFRLKAQLPYLMMFTHLELIHCLLMINLEFVL